MKFENIKVIADTDNSIQNKTIKITERHCFLEPTDIQTAEFFEDRLIRSKTPYVLVQCETTISLDQPGYTKGFFDRFKRGYAIFTELEVERASMDDAVPNMIEMFADEIAAQREDDISDAEVA